MKVEQFITPHKMNQDADERALQPTECRSKTNLRSGTLEGANSPWCENIKGTVEITNPYYESGDLMIGSVEDIANDAVIWFIYNKRREKQKIVRWKPHSDEIELILKHKYLNFKKTHPITHADIVDGLLYWTDGYDNSFISCDFNPPRKINIEKSKKFMDAYMDANKVAKYTHITSWTSGGNAYTKYRLNGNICPFPTGKKVVCFTEDGDVFGIRHKPSTGYCEIKGFNVVGSNLEVLTDRPWGGGAATQTRSGHIVGYDTDMYFGIDWQVLDRIKYKPENIPSASYDSDPMSIVNRLRNNLFQFSYRHIYDDHEKSAWSDPSIVPVPSSPELLGGDFDETSISDNVIHVWVESGPPEVSAIEIAVRTGNEGPWGLVYRIEKYDEVGGVLFNSDIFLLYRFYNNDVIQPLDNSDGSYEFRPFDYVPQVSSTQKLIEKNRIVDGNFIEGYDNVPVDVSLSVASTGVSAGAIAQIVKTYTRRNITALHDGGQDYFRSGIVDFGSLYQAGYTFVIHISAHPATNSDPTNLLFSPDAYAEFEGKFVSATAVVSVPSSGMSYGDFVNIVAGQLRYNSSTSRIIAIVPSLFATNNNDVFGAYTSFAVADGGTWLGASQLGFILAPYEGGGETNQFIYDQTTVSIFKSANGSTESHRTYKSGTVVPMCLWYRDRGGRMSAACLSDESSVYIPHQTDAPYVYGVKRSYVNWQINHRPPSWATEYCWGIAKSPTASYYLDAIVGDVKQTRGKLGIVINKYIIESNAELTKFNIRPYVWERGDRVRFKFFLSGTQWDTFRSYLDFEILGEETPMLGEAVYLVDENGDFILDDKGNKIADYATNRLLIPSFDYESYGIEKDSVVVEIYRPRKGYENPVYYQHGEWLPILNPHTANCMHGGDESSASQDQTTTLPAIGRHELGNSYIHMRLMGGMFPCESQWYSDYYDSAYTSIGTPNLQLRDMMRRRYFAGYRWSGKKIQGTMVNGLSTNYASDTDQLAEKYEQISVLSERGDTLRVLQKNKATSIYVGKSGLRQANIGGSELVTVSDSVLGSKNVWNADYGTVFQVALSPEYVYFYDIYNGCVVRWADNGMTRISDYGMKKYFRDLSRSLMVSGLQNVHVYAAFEKEYDNYILSFVDDFNPTNNATLLFHEPSNSWTTFVSFTPAWVGSCDITLFSSPESGKIYKHNVGTRNNFYGIQYDSEVELVSNAEPKQNKVFHAMTVHSNKRWGAPNTGDISINSNGVEMQSRLKAAQFQSREGLHTAAFLRDMMTSGTEKLDDLHNGRVLRGQSIGIKLTNSDTDEVVLFGVNVKSTISE